MTVVYDDVLQWIRNFAAEISDNKQHLSKLDAAIGDGDHGANMDRGMQAALAKLETVSGDDVGATLKVVGMALISKVGGAAGPLYGTLFLQLASATAGKSELGADDWSSALELAVKGVQARGKAELGDKTMIDALVPARDAFGDAVGSGASFGDALERSAAAAKEGMEATVPLVARKGRASYLGERSAGHQDPGATSSHMLLRIAAETWKDS
ncbi:MAG: dihydroxyacetone kinase subunit DhaL [Actinomycetota bacterium]|nr:dihydroxyacetone kinase subunit DhaL [Actinomycetota bacterium]